MTGIRGSKVAVIGAGAVGTSIAYASLIRGSAREVALYDIAAEKVDAEVLDLAHGTQFTGASVTGGADPAVLEGSDLVIVTAGAKQQPGQTRLELAGTNIRILEQLLPQVQERAPDATILLVTNPVDVLTVAAQQITGLPSGRVFGSGTVLDTSRLRWLLGRRLGVGTASVHADIVGEHGDTEFALWSTAMIGPVPLLEWAGPNRLSTADLDEIAAEVRDAAYRVIAGKGATNYAIGLAVARIVEAVVDDEQVVIPVSTVLDDYRGISGVALSVPCLVGAQGPTPVVGTSFSYAEDQKLRASAHAIRETLASVGVSA
ncbi:L-lactate dehydrogenase [Agromyces larvae]|uniref:L-lactate dehydrogenase n=1 Tax=Agromyces larvae TaxID=2929802 RepID=A0ABY4BTM6_9MICO|nr:L-lactate dehydrogenase [Agromyces larvae]UOE42561.1 L-lactate dehydrogenase [Agromyces larvae]